MAYSDLDEAERAHFDEYCRCGGSRTGTRSPTTRRSARTRPASGWTRAQNYIWRLANGIEGRDKGWKIANRQARYDQLGPNKLNTCEPRHEVRLPACGSLTASERVHIEEREGYLAIATVDAEQRARKIENGRWLINRRQQLYRLIKEEPRASNLAARQRRYRDLCIATQHGIHHTRWKRSHNAYGVPLKPEEPKSKGGREFCLRRARSYLGTSERPAGSNRGPHISDWQRRVYGSDGVAWCACFTTCMAWDAGVEGSGSAGVAVCMDLARRGAGIYRGITTNPDRVRKGDHAVISCGSCHIALVDGPSPWDTVEGNTSPGAEGSQFNGGTVADRNRRGAVVAWLLVRFDD